MAEVDAVEVADRDDAPARQVGGAEGVADDVHGQLRRPNATASVTTIRPTTS